MTLPVILCLIATVIPVFFSKISSAPTWLSLQALALGWITIAHHEQASIHTLMAALEVLVVRAWLVPALLRRALNKQSQGRMDLIPSNLFAWGIALNLIILAFKFGEGVRVDVRALTLGVVATTAMISFLILSSNKQPIAQLVALLFMENALFLFELLMTEPWPLPVHLAVSGVYILTVSVGSWLVSSPNSLTPSATDVVEEAS